MQKEFDLKTLRSGRTHQIVMDNRERVVFSGVIDVESFNEEEVVLVTEGGAIVLEGENLHISKLNLEEGQLIVEGFVVAVEYEDTAEPAKRGGMFSRIFK